MPRLFFVRHGTTDWNLEGRLQGQRDVRLNALGRRQAADCGTILGRLLAGQSRRPEEFAYVCSPLARARETMELMRQRLRLEKAGYRLDARLMELSFGCWEGATLAEIAAREAGAIAARERDKWAFTPPCGESYRQLALRVAAWLAAVAEPTVAVAHGGTARSLIALLQIAPCGSAPSIAIEQGVVYEFTARALRVYR